MEQRRGPNTLRVQGAAHGGCALRPRPRLLPFVQILPGVYRCSTRCKSLHYSLQWTLHRSCVASPRARPRR